MSWTGAKAQYLIDIEIEAPNLKMAIQCTFNIGILNIHLAVISALPLCNVKVCRHFGIPLNFNANSALRWVLQTLRFATVFRQSFVLTTHLLRTEVHEEGRKEKECLS